MWGVRGEGMGGCEGGRYGGYEGGRCVCKGVDIRCKEGENLPFD